MTTNKTNDFQEMSVGTYNFAELIGEEGKIEETTKEETKEETLEEEAAEEDNEEEETEVKEETKAEDNEEEEIEEEETRVEPKKEEKTSTTGKESVYSNLSRKYIESGYWEDAKIEYNGEEIAITDIKDLDEETFFLIQEAQNKELKDNFIDKREWDEVTEKIHTIHQKGGDITELLKIKEQYINPLDSYDLDNEQHQAALVSQMYAIESGGVLTQEEIRARVERDKEALELDRKAKAFEQKLRQSYEQTLKQQEEALIEAERERKKNFQNLRDSVSKEMETFGVKGSIVNTLIKNSMTLNEHGRVKVDDQFEELKKDPKKLAEFLVWYHNPEEYKKKVTGEEVIKRDSDILKKLNLIPKDKSKPASKKPKKGKTDELANRLMEM